MILAQFSPPGFYQSKVLSRESSKDMTGLADEKITCNVNLNCSSEVSINRDQN